MGDPKFRVHMAFLLLCTEEITLTDVTYFSKIYYHTKFQYLTLSDASVASMLQV